MAARAEPSCDELVHRVQALEAQLAEANEKLAALGAAQAQQQVDGCAQPAQQARMAPAAADTQLGKGPLDGIKVLDFSQYQNGPTATMMLSDYGAEVMKVERPGGEAGRSLGTHDKTGYYFSTYFQALNRGKKSCPLDMNKEGARDVVKRMVQWCDVIVENFKPGAFAKMGYSYEQLKEWNPSIIYASNGGFGQKGEWAPRGSFDAVCQGFSGWMVSQGGGPDHPPCLAPFGLGDQVGALYFAYAIMGALVAKERYGMGQQIECSQLGAMTMLQGLGITATLHSGRENNSGNHGHETPNAHFTWYKCSDGKYLTTCALAANQWHSLCDAIDRPDLKESWSAIMGTMYAGSEMHEKLQEEVFGTNTRDYWLDRLIGNGGIPTAPILSYVEVCQEKQFWDNDYFVNIPYPEYEAHFGKPYRAIGFPATFSVSQPPPPSSPAPELGQHTIECLTEKLGYNEAEAKGLIGEGITHEATPQTLHGKM